MPLPCSRSSPKPFGLQPSSPGLPDKQHEHISVAHPAPGAPHQTGLRWGERDTRRTEASPPLWRALQHPPGPSPSRLPQPEDPPGARQPGPLHFVVPLVLRRKLVGFHSQGAVRNSQGSSVGQGLACRSARNHCQGTYQLWDCPVAGQ